MDRPRLSVVVASNNARTSIKLCLDALVRQTENIEVLIVDNSTDGTAELIASGFPDLERVSQPPEALIPELWAVGMRRCHGEIVAITTAHCVPSENWCERILAAHEADRAAIGGAVANDPSGSLVDWAVFFCRYSAYMPPLMAGVVPEIPGDNASYRAAELDLYRDSWRDGFWEPVFHKALKDAGHELWLDPTILVTHRRSFDFLGFVKGRFRHGLQFGAWRASRVSAGRKVLYVCLYPLIPLVLLLRVLRQVAGKGENLGRLLLSVPALLSFFTAWATGELVGTLLGPEG